MATDVDVLIVGAGISGIGAAHYLREAHPRRSMVILEGRGAIGGTWDLFRYPGIRSDSDLYTFGYEFAPWRGDAIADGPSILAYLHQVVDDEQLTELIRLKHHVTGASWSSSQARWTVEAVRTDTGETVEYTTRWLLNAGGYYRYSSGYTPEFPGRDLFTGRIVHPQQWPDDLDYTGARIIIIGSGATAVTLAPALAETAGAVTVLQRTPTYILPLPSRDRAADLLSRVLGPARSFHIIRAKNVLRQRLLWSLSMRFPDAMRRLIRSANSAALPTGYPVDIHFNPPYPPWDQRLCAAPDGDFFNAISNGSVEMVTDTIDTFTPEGIRLASGRELAADIIVTATGLAVEPYGGATLTVDGRPVELPDTLAYKGMMLSGVPNMSFIVGYTNSSWTLKVEPLSRHLCALLGYMDDNGFDTATPEPADPDMPTRPFLDFGAGYITRVSDRLPRQGDRWPWLTSMDYLKDRRLLRADKVVDPELRLTSSSVRQRSSMTQV